MNFSTLKGKIIVKIEGKEGDEELIFTTSDDKKYIMHHHQDCCENVYLESITGNIEDLIDVLILQAEESTNSRDIIDGKPNYPDSWTWTFYKLATRKGYVTLRWLGESNGYYSESVDFEEIK